MTLAQTELKKIYLGPNVIDMQGPAPTGYHVPSKDENVALVAAMTALGMDTSNGNCMKTYLKMPFAGCRRSSSSIYNQGETGFYWSATAAGAHYARVMLFYSDSLYPQLGDCRAFGYSIRCFKNTPAIPDNNWTTLFNGSSIATGAGIFHNTTAGLISISSDGQNRITIQDKNLGASSVYNDGDTLSETNCGKYFQWGNNYGFAWTGSITTSSTKVDASNYGPGNYYSSSTFITTDITDWSSVQNDNLWGGQYTPIKRVTIRPNGTEKQIRPAIKEYDIDINNFESTTTFNYGSRGTAFSTGGYYFYSGGGTQINAYKLSTPYDVNNYIELKTENIPSTNEIHQIYISPDGTKLAWANYKSYIGIYDLTTPYDISTKTNLITSNPGYCTGIWFKPDGTELYVARYSGPGLIQYHLSTPWDISTASATASFGGSYRCVSLSPDGQYLLYADNGGTVYQMKLTTPRDITTRQNYKSLSSNHYPTLAVDGACFLNSNFMGKFYEL